MSMKWIVHITSEFLTAIIFISSGPHFWAPGQPPHLRLPNSTNRIDQTGCFL